LGGGFCCRYRVGTCFQFGYQALDRVGHGFGCCYAVSGLVSGSPLAFEGDSADRHRYSWAWAEGQ
jgi:putative component of membrane protein insertase Oxa1/YidC/SpoIIIJ protein YidD